MAAVFKEQGTTPVLRDVFIISIRMGQRAGRQALTRGVGMGSMRQVVGLALVTRSWTVCSSTAEKADND